MAANTDPIYSSAGAVSSDASTAMAPTLTSAATSNYDGTNANNDLVFTAGAMAASSSVCASRPPARTWRRSHGST